MLQKIASYASYALTTPVIVQEIDGKESSDLFRRVNRLADLALTPVRYFLNDKPVLTISYRNARPTEISSILEIPSGRRSFAKTILSIASFVPALILGVIGKAIALTNSTVRNDISNTSSYFNLHTQIKASNQVLAPKIKELMSDTHKFYKYLLDNMAKGEGIWDEEATLTQFEAVFQKTSLFMDTLFDELAVCAKHDAKKMAELLSYQPHSYKSEPLFCFGFFTSSIWGLYEDARNCRHYIDPKTVSWSRSGRIPFIGSELTAKNETPYFTEGSRQHAWRILYNKHASKLDDPIYTSNEQKTMRDYVKEYDVGDNRCNVRKDEERVVGKLGRFIALPGCPTMDLPESLK